MKTTLQTLAILAALAFPNILPAAALLVAAMPVLEWLAARRKLAKAAEAETEAKHKEIRERAERQRIKWEDPQEQKQEVKEAQKIVDPSAANQESQEWLVSRAKVVLEAEGYRVLNREQWETLEAEGYQTIKQETVEDRALAEYKAGAWPAHRKA